MLQYTDGCTSNDIMWSRRSIVHQMIMGSGKTTVVAPLLSLLLGDGETLVVSVVPKSLLEFTRGVVRSTFGDTVLSKPIYTLPMERSTKIDERLVFKLKTAAAARGVVVTHPTALKSFVLKFVELLHTLDQDHTSAESVAEGPEAY